MILLTGPKKSGKTLDLIHLAQKNNGILIVRNNDVRKNLEKYTDVDIMTFSEMLIIINSKRFSRPLYIDDIDKCLENYDVKGISITNED